ncbi:Undecaprenyl-phosphate 4-deoxy-4-formamido-L-arabinose transferase [bioreactor metagenome]|uniref:Undecaprenyl-phosphate 4-deoxy-4-formamido-L-arabinose transferase n=1 Tax=bioreactor metagenome TaxID=1076179 RepID=A0A644WS20_9ZZZZ
MAFENSKISVDDFLSQKGTISPKNLLRADLKEKSHIGLSRQFDEIEEKKIRTELVNRSLLNEEYKKQLVSIIMPTWNRQEQISAAIESVLAQTFTNWELIIIDDSSDDGTDKVIDKYLSDTRISYISIPKLGVSAARNKGIEASHGTILAYLDSDNQWYPEFLQIAVIRLITSGADIVYTAQEIENDDGLVFRYREFDYNDLIKENFIDLNILIHWKHLLTPGSSFDETLRRMVDWDFLIRLCKGRKVIGTPILGVKYNNHLSAKRISTQEIGSWKYVINNKYLIDWESQKKNLSQRKDDVVSIIIPVYNNKLLTDNCLASILENTKDLKYEIILVDNKSEQFTSSQLDLWANLHPEIKVVHCWENLNFALGCNLGFSVSTGSRVVFLNNDTLVTEGWLSNLLEPLKDTSIGAVQPKLVYPDMTVQSYGIVFSSHSSIGYQLFQGEEIDKPYVNKEITVNAITAACLAINASYFCELTGFDPIFINGQEDVDFCFRLWRKFHKKLLVEPNSTVIHLESKTQGRGRFIFQNRRIYYDRWHEKIIPDDEIIYSSNGIIIEKYIFDTASKISEELNTAVPEKVISPKMEKVEANYFKEGNCDIAIKISCPDIKQRNQWGDYHFAVGLADAFAKFGYRPRIDFLPEWYKNKGTTKINFFIHGLSSFQPIFGEKNFVWIISHPNEEPIDYLSKFDKVFVASNSYATTLSNNLGDKVIPLLQCTEPAIFYPGKTNSELRNDILFVGNSRNVFRPIIQKSIKENILVSIYGSRWDNFVDRKFIKGQSIPNILLGDYYRSAKVILNDHWEDMKRLGFVSNRLFDVLATGIPVISDEVEGIPEEFSQFIYFYEKYSSLKEVVDMAISEDPIMKYKRYRFSKTIRENHSFEARAKEIIQSI